MPSILRFFTSSLALATSVWIMGSGKAIAAETIILKYKIFETSVSVQDLTTLAETGEAPQPLQAFLSMAQQDPQAVRQTLTSPVEASPILLDRVLNHWLGETLLDRLGQVVHTSAGGADRQALRAAIVLSAAPDGQLTLLEVLQNYPTQEVEVEGEQLLQAVDQLNRFAGIIRNIL